jgi:hypothetical protein
MSFGKVAITSLVDGSSVIGTADANGSFPIPSSGVTFPALVRVEAASGRKANYGYIASSAQTDAPATPLSTLVLAIAGSGNPEKFSSGIDLTPSKLESAKAAVRSIFSNVFQAFAVSSDVDLLAKNFATDHTGFDLLLDAVNVRFDIAGNPTLCTKVLNICKTLNLANVDTSPIAFSASESSALQAVPIAACSNAINALSVTSMTSDSAIYASDFLNAGLNAQGYMAGLAGLFSGKSVTFKNPLYVGSDANNNYVFQFDYYDSADNTYVGGMSTPFKLDVNGKCVLAGDQLPFTIQVFSQIFAQSRVDGTSNPAVTTSSPLRGLIFRAGGDGFGGQGTATVKVNGNDVTITKLQFLMCDSNQTCSAPMIEMVKAVTNSGFYYTPGNVNTLPVKDYSSVGINSSSDFYNGNPNPVVVKMFDANNVEQKRVSLKIRGGYISGADMNSLNLPSVTNAQAILSTQSTLVDPSLALNIPTGFIAQSASISSGLASGKVSGTSKFVLSATASSIVVPRTLNPSDTYRAITLTSNTTGGISVFHKYVWSPVCSGCV